MATQAQIPAVLEPGQTVQCEQASARVDIFLGRFEKGRDIMVIASQGSKEGSGRYATRRLREVQRYLTVYHRETQLGVPEKLTLATALEKDITPELNFFMNGKLELILRFRNKGNLVLLPCGLDKI